MSSCVTSFNALFSLPISGSAKVERIEIPLIQRDYAQGREGGAVARVRADFLDALHDAVVGPEALSLDFVYGDVEGGTLRPLDGQQRLTTLFLLHWYLAYRADTLAQQQGWKRFSYATRPGARMFCERLAGCQPPAVDDIVEWLEDQPWFLHTWRHDPTIQSMLVMLDAIRRRFANDDHRMAWNRLVDTEAPAISFHLLPIAGMGLSEDLYIKMNSRGKPLTAFETFKARFEQLLDKSCPDRVGDFARKVDGDWANVLWPYRGNDSIVDDEFLRYFNFLTEVSAWHEGSISMSDMTTTAERIYGPTNPKAAAHLDFLFKCFDMWVETDIAAAFAHVFASGPASLASGASNRVPLFGPHGDVNIDLFAACCEDYGNTRGRNRVFGWGQTLHLYAMLVHRIESTPELASRMRVLRNLIEASSNELRLEKMPNLLADVRRLIVDGHLEGISSFNQAQVEDERLKANLLLQAPQLRGVLHALEDHPVLRGCLGAFELDEATFEHRARTFQEIFSDPELLPALTGALLAMGNYSQALNQRVFQFGSGSNLAQWRAVLTGARRDLGTTREVLGRLLDALTTRQRGLDGIASITTEWLEATVEAHGLDWRWYFVKYPAMREGRSGLYVGVNGMLGYSICMLDRTQMNSWYRDPYLTAIHRESGVETAIEDPWFTGYETQPRWMRFKASGAELQCVEDGFRLRPPMVAHQAELFWRVCKAHGVGEDLNLGVPQVEAEGRLLDTSDRVRLGAALVRDLARAGL